MGKVLSSFTNGYAGAIARGIDDIVVALANKSDAAIAFGIAVALSADKTGIVPFDPSAHTGADFVGFTVRNPSKTPDAYGASVGSYAANDLADVLVRGHIAVRVTGTAALGDPVAVDPSSGNLVVADGTSGQIVLPNVRVSAIPDGNHMAEVVLTGRNVI